MSDLYTPDDVLWRPSRALHDRLLIGVVAVLTAGTLSATSSWLELSGADQPGFDLCDGLALGALLPQFGILAAWWGVSREADLLALRKAGLGLYGVNLLMHLITFTDTDFVPFWLSVVVWVVMGLGGLGLIALVLNLESWEPATKPEEPVDKAEEPVAAFAEPPPAGSEEPAPEAEKETDNKETDNKEKGWGCGAAVLVAGLVKGAIRLLGRKAGGWVAPLLQFLIMLLLLGSGAWFLVWGALVKIRARQRLGGMAALLGVLELVLLAGVIGGFVWLGVGIVDLVWQGNANDDQIDALGTRIGRVLATGALAADVLWSLLTAIVFLGLRGRYDPFDAP